MTVRDLFAVTESYTKVQFCYDKEGYSVSGTVSDFLKYNDYVLDLEISFLELSVDRTCRSVMRISVVEEEGRDI